MFQYVNLILSELFKFASNVSAICQSVAFCSIIDRLHWHFSIMKCVKGLENPVLIELSKLIDSH